LTKQHDKHSLISFWKLSLFSMWDFSLTPTMLPFLSGGEHQAMIKALFLDQMI